MDTFVGGGYSRVMVFNATFNNISVISWRSAFLVEKTGVPGKNHRLSVFSERQCMTLNDFGWKSKKKYNVKLVC